MRFNCQSCGAKYQIADEKVAGKTVRMKCRKCGTLIQVKAQQAPSGVTATHVDPNAPPSSRIPLGGAPASQRRPPTRKSSAPRIPAAGNRPLPPRAAPRSAPGRRGGPPRPAGLRDRPAPPGARPAAPPQRPSAPGRSFDEEAESTVVMMRPSEEILAAQRPPPAAGRPASEPDAAGRSDWYVGIAGTPVGPVDERYLKEQLDLGKVGGQSLVWHEGMTDWKPLNSFPALRELLSRRAEVSAPAAEVSDPVALTRRAPEPAPASVEVPVSSAPASHEPASSARPEPAVAAAPSRPSIDAPLSSNRPSSVHDTSPESEEAPPMSVPPDSTELAAAGIPARDRRHRKRRINPMAYAFIAMATAFGAVSAWFLFGAASTPPNPDGTTGPVASIPGGGAAGDGQPRSGASGEPAASGTAVVVDGVEVDGPPRVGGTLPMTTGTTSAAPAESGTEVASKGKPPKPCSPDDPFCDKGPSGPSATGPSDGSGESGQGLSPGQASATVSQYKGSLMRKCRSLVTKGSAKVAATIVVGPSGSVKSASVSGGKDYPGLAGCVKSRIMNWSFPPSGGDTTINVSFNFL